MDKLIRGAYFHFSMTLYYSAKDFTCCKALTKGGHGMKLYYSPTVGYKVTSFESGTIRSGANARISHQLKIGEIITMPQNGVYLSNKPDYVMDYYSGLSENEIVLKLHFDPADIIDGKEQLNDAQPEIGVSKVRIVGYQQVEKYKQGNWKTIMQNDHSMIP